MHTHVRRGGIPGIAVIALGSLVLPAQARAEIVVAKNVSHSEATVLLSDSKLVNRRIELVSASGAITTGKLKGFSNGEVLLRAAPSVPLSGLRIVRISHAVASPLRRTAGIVVGVFAGSFVGASVAGAFLFAGAETAGIATYFTFPVVGGWAGSKLIAKRRAIVYLLEPLPSGSHPVNGPSSE